MSFLNSVKAYFLKCIDLRSRSSRSEYWWANLFLCTEFFPFVFLVGFSVSLIFSFMGISQDAVIPLGNIIIKSVLIFLLIASTTLSIRRLHDIDRSGWWFLITFTIIGLIPLLVWCCTKGTDGENRFGKNSLE